MKPAPKKLRFRATMRITTAKAPAGTGVSTFSIARVAPSGKLSGMGYIRRVRLQQVAARKAAARIVEIASSPISDVQRSKAQLLVERAREAQRSPVTDKFRLKHAA
jgi:hypothetical protein